MGPGTRTAYQHDARALTMPGPRGRMLISLFDNGGTPKVHRQSRALVEDVDLARHTVTLLTQPHHSPPLLSPSQGSRRCWRVATRSSAGARNRGSPNTTPRASRSSTPTSRPWSSPTGRCASTGTEGRPSPRPRPSSRRDRSVSDVRELERSTALASCSACSRGARRSGPAALRAPPPQGFETRIVAPRTGSVIRVEALDGAGEVIASTKTLTPGRARPERSG